MDFIEDEAFGGLRSLLQATPSISGFAKICRAVQHMEEAEPGLFSRRYHDYVVGTLDAWPRHRRVLKIDDGLHHVSTLAWAPLARSLRLRVNTTAQLEALLGGVEGMEHLSVTSEAKQKPLLDAIDSGLFDGLKSLEFDGMPLRAKLFEEIVARLSTRGGFAALEELRFTKCNIKKAHVEALCASPLPERLRTLGLSHNTSLKTSGVQTLTAIAGRFGRLERLELHDAEIKAPAAKAIATAGWSNPLEYVGLHGNPLKPAAFEALDAADMLAAIVDRQGAPSFDLSGYELDAATLAMFLERGLFDGLDTLQSISNHDATGWEVLVEEVGRLSGLRGFVSGTPALYAPLTAPLLEVARLERLELSGRLRCLDEDAFVALLRDHDTLQKLDLRWGTLTDDYGAKGLEALMSWDRWGEVDDVRAAFRVRQDHRLFEQVASHGRFQRDHQNTSMGPRFTSAASGSYYTSGNHCVLLDGHVSSLSLIHI